MTSMTGQHHTAASRARSAAQKTADFWTQGVQKVTNLLPGLPQVDLVPAVDRYFEFVQRTVDVNHQLAVRWAEAVGTLSGVVRDKAESAGDAVRERAEVAGDVVRGQAERAERELARQARQRTRQRYEGLTKAELADLLARRELPKTGNVDELIERLVEADSK